MNSGSCPAIERAAVPAVFRVSMKSATQSAQAPRTHPRSHALRSERPDAAGTFARTAVWLVIGLTAANVISTLLECGLAACPADPVAYELLKGMR